MDIMTINARDNDEILTVRDVLNEKKLLKQLLKENLLGDENMLRVKKDNLNSSLRVCSFGRKQIWVQEKFNFKPPKITLKAPTRRFNQNGKEIVSG